MALFKYASDPDVGPRAGWPAHKSVDESREIIRTFFNNDTTWAIVLKETGEAIGCMGYCFQAKHFENTWADHFTGNSASERVMEKCSFSDTGMLNRCSQLVGGDKDMVKVFK